MPLRPVTWAATRLAPYLGGEGLAGALEVRIEPWGEGLELGHDCTGHRSITWPEKYCPFSSRFVRTRSNSIRHRHVSSRAVEARENGEEGTLGHHGTCACLVS